LDLELALGFHFVLKALNKGDLLLVGLLLLMSAAALVVQKLLVPRKLLLHDPAL
jgi:hypothetical protein